MADELRTVTKEKFKGSMFVGDELDLADYPLMQGIRKSIEHQVHKYAERDRPGREIATLDIVSIEEVYAGRNLFGVLDRMEKGELDFYGEPVRRMLFWKADVWL
jgi:hypothetical protein